MTEWGYMTDRGAKSSFFCISKPPYGFIFLSFFCPTFL